MHYSLPTSGGDDDDDQAGNSNVLAQMLLGAAQPNLLENLSRFNLLKGMAGQSSQPNLAFKSKIFVEKFLFTNRLIAEQLGSPPQPASTTTTQLPDLQSQMAINLLMKISQSLEELRQESKTSLSSLEQHFIRSNAIMDQRNAILEKQREIEEKRFELEKKRFEMECEKRDSHQMQS